MSVVRHKRKKKMDAVSMAATDDLTHTGGITTAVCETIILAYFTANKTRKCITHCKIVFIQYEVVFL